jgi:transcriptional regulator with XRE-family HTH domain
MSNALKAYRKKERLSQQAIANKLGISRAMVGLLENGHREFSAEISVLIEKNLGINRVMLRPDLFRA